MRSSGIGGQAVIEGIMMKNKDRYAVAVRKPDQEIEVEVRESGSVMKNPILKKIPIVRGVLSFVESLVLGMRTLTFSAEFYEEEETAKPGKTEKALDRIFKDKSESVVMGLTVIFSLGFAVAIFMILPYYISELLRPYVISSALMALIEGILRLAIFIGYIFLITLMKDIRRVFMYHGAEHKCINCVESGLPLTVENVRISSRLHKRCGTSFLLIVMIVSIIFFFFIHTPNPVWRVVIRLLLVPVIAGVSYEFIRLAGSSDSILVNLLSAPGMLLQRLTTREPDDSMIEVAIRAVEAVFDWKQYLADEGKITQEELAQLRAEEGFEFIEDSEEN